MNFHLTIADKPEYLTPLRKAYLGFTHYSLFTQSFLDTLDFRD